MTVFFYFGLTYPWAGVFTDDWCFTNHLVCGKFIYIKGSY